MDNASIKKHFAFSCNCCCCREKETTFQHFVLCIKLRMSMSGKKEILGTQPQKRNSAFSLCY